MYEPGRSDVRLSDTNGPTFAIISWMLNPIAPPMSRHRFKGIDPS